MDIEAVAVGIDERSKDAGGREQQGAAEPRQKLRSPTGLGRSQCIRQIAGGICGENDDARGETGMHIGPNYK